MEIGSTTLEGSLLWANVAYVGIVFGPVAWLFFAFEYTNPTRKVTWRTAVPFIVEPLFILLVAWTDGLHHLFRASVTLDSSGPFAYLVIERGPIFWVHVAYCNSVLAYGTYLLIRAYYSYQRAVPRPNWRLGAGCLCALDHQHSVHFARSAGLGAWENLHEHADGARFREAVQREAACTYGTAYSAFLARVGIEREKLQTEFDKMRQKFESAHLTVKAGGQAMRAATRFAAVGFAGELATEWGITGWPPGAAVGAAHRMFDDWLHSFGGEEYREPRRMVEQVRDWINANAPSRLADWRRKSDDHAPRTVNQAGWRRPTKDTTNLPNDDQVFEYLIYPGAFRTELANGFDPEQVAKELARRGYLEHAERRLQVKVREPGAAKPIWFYLIMPAIKGGDDD